MIRPALAFLLALLPVCAAAADADRYARCTDLARTKPAESLKIADDWLQESGVASAHHCRAISLFALKRYGEAGQALQTLGGMIEQTSPLLWVNVMRQSAKAWELSGDKARAVVTLTQAIQSVSEESLKNPTAARIAADLLLDRSRLYASGGRELYAIQDLDHAVSLAPDNDALRLARAESLLRQSAGSQALADVEAVLAKKPGHVPAQELKAKIESQ